MKLSQVLTAATLAVAAATAANAQDTTKCARPAQPAQPEKPNAAVTWGADLLGGIAKGVVNDATKGLGGEAAKAIKGAAGDNAKYVGGAANEVKKGVDQAGRAGSKAAQNAAKSGTTAAAGAVGETFTKCGAYDAPAQAPAPAASAPVTTGEAPAVDHGVQNAEAFKNGAKKVGGWLQGLTK